MSSTSIPQPHPVGETDLECGHKEALFCPSAQPDWEGAKAFGVVTGTVTVPAVSYLAQVLPMSQQLVELTRPVSPAEVFRIAAPCATDRCQHFEDGHCQLVSRTIAHLEPVTEKLPQCLIRVSCRWWNEHGKEACYRCPQVVTNSFSRDEKIILVATPQSRTQREGTVENQENITAKGETTARKNSLLIRY